MNQSAWLTLTTLREPLQVLTLRIPALPAAALTGKPLWSLIPLPWPPETLSQTSCAKLSFPKASRLPTNHICMRAMPANRPGGETHFRVYIVSQAFRGEEPDRTPSHDKCDVGRGNLRIWCTRSQSTHRRRVKAATARTTSPPASAFFLPPRPRRAAPERSEAP